MRHRFLIALVTVAVFAGLCTAADADSLVPTRDGGWYWQNPLPHGNPIADVEFVDADFGWAVGGWNIRTNYWWWDPSSGQILHTRDGGHTWSVQYCGH